MDEKSIKSQVQKHYAAVAKSSEPCCAPTGSCCGDQPVVNPLVDYGDLSIDLVEGADLGLGCGLPTQHADPLKIGGYTQNWLILISSIG